MRGFFTKRGYSCVVLLTVVVVVGVLSSSLKSAPSVTLPEETGNAPSLNLPEENVAEAEASPTPGPEARVGNSSGASSGAPRSVPGQIILKFREGTGPAQKQNVRRAEKLETMRGLPFVRAEVARVNGRTVEEALRALKRRPEVEFAEPDYIVRASGYADEPFYKDLWGLNNSGQAVQGTAGTHNVDINGPEAAGVTLGRATVVVAVIDEGVDLSHPDLSARRWVNPGESGTKANNGVDDDLNGYIDDLHGWDFYNNDNTVYDSADGDAHGTHVAGTIAGSINGKGIVGVAPNVKVMALKFLGPEGGSVSSAISAIEYATKKGVRISNNSWGGPGYSQALKNAIEASGQLFVAAAGNASKNQDTDPDPDYPAAFASANLLSVAAVDNKGSLASFSNYGATTVDIAAPGVNILSSIPGGYSFYSGTSMAAPHVSGVAALARSVNLGLNATGLKDVVLKGGKNASATTGKTATGKEADARAVLSLADTTPPAVKPTVQVLPVPEKLGTSAVPVRISWPAAADSGSGVARYQLQQGANGTFQNVSLPSALSRSKDVLLEPGTNNYTFRVRAFDRVGNASPWAAGTGPTFRVAAYQEGSSAIAYSGTWNKQAPSGAYKTYVKYATAFGARAKHTFTGRNIGWVASRNSTSGGAEVYLDGTRVATVDLYSATAKPRQIVFSRAVTAGTTHTLEIRGLGTSGRPRVDVDAFVVLRTP